MLEFGKRYSYLRVYFNKRSDFPNVWSVDDGNQDNEINVSKVCFGAEVYPETAYSGDKPNEDSPVAWLEVEDSVPFIYSETVWDDDTGEEGPSLDYIVLSS
jgi:hypothetical protein